MLKSLTLRVKLILAFLFIAVIIAGVSYFQAQLMQGLGSQFTNLIDQDFARINALEDMELSSVNLRDKQAAYQQDLTGKDMAKTKSQRQAVLAQAADLQNRTQLYLSLTKVDNPYVSQQIVDRIATSGDKIVSLTRTIADNNTSDTQTALRGSRVIFDQAISEASSSDRTGINAVHATISATIRRVLWIIVALAITASIMALLMGAAVATWISRSLARLRIGAERIANGDFSQAISTVTHDEIGQLAATFNRMAARLKESYRRLALSRQQDEAMLQGMGEGLVALDESGKIVMTNRVATQLLGSGEKTVIGRQMQDVYNLYDADSKKTRPEDEAILPIDQRPGFLALKSGNEVHGTYGFYDASGQKHQLYVSASPVKLDGLAAGVVMILRDITKEKEIDRMKTEFISLASHQLRTPLSAIKWFCEMLISGDAGELTSDQKEFAQNISDSTERMIALVNALLNISRIESGRIMIDPKPTDLRELVGGITNDLKAKTEEKKQTLIISVHEDLPKINIDPRLIGQVYLNLLTNAIKYTPKGGEITVFISKKNDEIISQITDNGYGIPKEQQRRIFEKFFRASNAVKVETDGTGLGLYLIKAVVESSGGRIWFKSEENKGTTFWFSIPLSGMKAKEGEVTLDV